jgi:hypothetical protein
MGARFETIQYCTETIKWFGQELMDTTYTQNAMTVGIVVANKNIGLPKRSVCAFINN